MYYFTVDLNNGASGTVRHVFLRLQNLAACNSSELKAANEISPRGKGSAAIIIHVCMHMHIIQN